MQLLEREYKIQSTLHSPHAQQAPQYAHTFHSTKINKKTYGISFGYMLYFKPRALNNVSNNQVVNLLSINRLAFGTEFELLHQFNEF